MSTISKQMNNANPLSLIRQATMTGTPVNYVENHYIFGPYKFHETTKTFFKRTLKSNNTLLILLLSLI